MSWQIQTHLRARIVLDQLRAALDAAPDEAARADFLARADNPYFALLDRLYGEDYPLARLLDRSDLVVHAEGPELADAMPALRATAWLCEAANRELRHLVLATMDLSRPVRRKVAGAINLRLTGLAPGSLYAGFALKPIDTSGLLDPDQEPGYLEGRAALQGLARIPAFIDDERLLPGIAEAMPDPAVRDASLLAALNLAPTGRMGIHTLGLAVPGAPSAGLGPRERVVLRQALHRPALTDGKPGRFVGEVRALDIDKTRFHLRDVPGVGALRCVMPEDWGRAQIKAITAELVAVTGRYLSDADGRPRLMVVEHLDVLARPRQTELDC